MLFMKLNKIINSKKITLSLDLGRIAGIEPASSPWQREILPFDHIRIFLFLIHNMYPHI